VAGWLLTTLLLAIPENFLQLYVALSLQGATVPLRRLAGYASLAAVALKVLRLLPWKFGLHVPFHAALMVVLIRHLTRGPWTFCLIGALVGQLLVAIGEGLVAAPLLQVLRIPLSEALSSPWLNIAFGYVADTFLFLVAGYLWASQRHMKARAGR